MRMHEASLYLPFTKHDPRWKINCPNCKDTYVLGEGVAAQASCEGEAITVFLCSETCWLTLMHPANMGRVQ